LRIIVLVKQVPDPQHIKIDPKTGFVIRTGVPLIVNPFDLYAVELALRIKSEYGGEVVAISMGPPSAEEALREVLAMGVDKAILLTDRRMAGADTLATSYTLSMAIRKVGDFDLILAGEKTVDGDTGHIGPEVAEFLGIPHVCYVSNYEGIKEGYIYVKARYDDYLLRLKVKLPALLTVTRGELRPRIPTILGRLRASKIPITKWNADDIGCDISKIGLQGSPTRVLEVFTPRYERKCKMFYGDPEELAKKFIDVLKELGFV